MKDYYHDLHLDRNKNPSQQAIKAAYYQLAKQCHPDTDLDNKQVNTEMFQTIAEAYEVLSCPQTRAAYDEEYEANQKNQWHALLHATIILEVFDIYITDFISRNKMMETMQSLMLSQLSRHKITAEEKTLLERIDELAVLLKQIREQAKAVGRSCFKYLQKDELLILSDVLHARFQEGLQRSSNTRPNPQQAVSASSSHKALASPKSSALSTSSQSLVSHSGADAENSQSSQSSETITKVLLLKLLLVIDAMKEHDERVLQEQIQKLYDIQKQLNSADILSTQIKTVSLSLHDRLEQEFMTGKFESLSHSSPLRPRRQSQSSSDSDSEEALIDNPPVQFGR